MIDNKLIGEVLPKNGRVLFIYNDGAVIGLRIIKENEHIASLNALIDLAKSAGYSVVMPDGNAL